VITAEAGALIEVVFEYVNEKGGSISTTGEGNGVKIVDAGLFQ
jgi:hypothetical protein